MSRAFGAFPAAFRSPETESVNMQGMFIGILIAMFAVACISAKGYGSEADGRGLRFGVLVVVFNADYIIATYYAVLNVGCPSGPVDGAGLAGGMAGDRSDDRPSYGPLLRR